MYAIKYDISSNVCYTCSFCRPFKFNKCCRFNFHVAISTFNLVLAPIYTFSYISLIQHKTSVLFACMCIIGDIEYKQSWPWLSLAAMLFKVTKAWLLIECGYALCVKMWRNLTCIYSKVHLHCVINVIQWQHFVLSDSSMWLSSAVFSWRLYLCLTLVARVQWTAVLPKCEWFVL
jgi:hypothetical protein